MTASCPHVRSAVAVVIANVIVTVTAFVALTGAVQAAPAPDPCAGLKRLPLARAVVVSAEAHDAGTFTPPPADGAVAKPADVARPFCRVVVAARPVAGSDIGIEVWLPLPADWNHRLWGLGNGEFGGTIFHRGLAARIGGGYAAVATDGGHRADPYDMRWARGQPQKLIDFGHRAIHLAVVHGKTVAAAYYGTPPRHAYFASFSNGGRQALLLAQRYPSDYDGLIAGAPRADWTRQVIDQAQIQFNWLADAAHHVPQPKIDLLAAAVLAACDTLDGVADGVIEAPMACRFDPGALVCAADAAGVDSNSNSNTNSCLTPGELASVQRLYALGFAFGSEARWGPMWFGSGYGTSAYFGEVNAFWPNAVFDDPKRSVRSFDPVRDGALAQRKLAPVFDATNPDLRRFIRRGGKLIVYQGWNNPAVPAAAAIDYHTRVVHALGPASAGGAVRLFMAPGVEHASGGPGPDRFGQFTGGVGDAAQSIGAALQRWVEAGVAPERVIATRQRVAADGSTEVVRTRPLCAHPKVARYGGSGSTDDAANFDCADAR